MRQACRECWDPVDRDGTDLCDWCGATVAQRRRRMVRDLCGLFAVLGTLALIGFLAK